MRIQNINWNAAPFDMNNKISKEVRSSLTKRFDAAIMGIRGVSKYNDLKLENGWIVKSKTDVSFILNSGVNENYPDNADLGVETFNSAKTGAKLRRLDDAVWDSETYAELNKVEGIFTDPTTGKITIKAI